MRYALMLLIGLLAGFLMSSFATRALGQRHVWPRSVMTLIGVHQRALKRELAAPACRRAAADRELDRMAWLSDEIGPAFAERDDPVFAGYRDDLQQAIARARAASTAGCAALVLPVQGITRACENCHRDYR